MSTGSWPTLADVAARIGPDQKPLVLANMLSQSIALTDDLAVTEANEMGSHEFGLLSSIPAGFFRVINQGVPNSKVTSSKARVGLSMLEDYSQVDLRAAEMSGDVEQFRETSDIYFLEGMGQTLEQTAFYGNPTANPAQFAGLATFYNTVDPTAAANAGNVIDGGGTGSSNTSIWLVCHGLGRFYGVYPRKSMAGLTMENLGRTRPGYDAVGNMFEALTSWFRAQLAIVPQDWRCVVRYCNLDVTNQGLAGPNPPDLFVDMSKMLLLVPSLGKGVSGVAKTDDPTDPTLGVRPVFYTSRTGMHWLTVQSMRNKNTLIPQSDYAGRPTETYRQIPIKVTDQILTTEARVQ